MTTSPLLTDLYQLTMLRAYQREGMAEGEATFSLFVRRLKGRHYLVAAGLEQALTFLEDLRFDDEALAYLATLDAFDDAFVDTLRPFRFTGDVWALPEGTPFFADEPLLEVTAPLGQAQLVETFLLNALTFATAVASKAARVVQAARGRTVAEFGARRLHGADAALLAARSAYLAGADATSNVLAGQRYGIPVTGTMAHSYVQAHAHEADAFRAFAETFPGTTLLVDTFDTLRGIETVIRLREELGEAFRIGAVRLDSGDLGKLAREARALLDDAGMDDVQLFASNSLDEHAITQLLDDGAPIDGFGVGTRLGTVADRPYLDTVYKLAAFQGEGRMKLATDKSNLPHPKQIYRFVDGDGTFSHDVLALREEELDGTPLLQQVMRDGKRTDAGRDTLEDARQRCAEALPRLPKRLLELGDDVEPYPVDVSERLQGETDALAARLREREGLAR